MACGLATLRELKETNPYDKLETLTTRLVKGLSEAATQAGIAHQTAQVGSMFTLFFNPSKKSPTTASSAKNDTKQFARYFWGMLDRGIYFPCSQFEANFVSTAHTQAMIDQTITAAREVLREFA